MTGTGERVTALEKDYEYVVKAIERLDQNLTGYIEATNKHRTEQNQRFTNLEKKVGELNDAETKLEKAGLDEDGRGFLRVGKAFYTIGSTKAGKALLMTSAGVMFMVVVVAAINASSQIASWAAGFTL